jgi:hypothetical protein
LGNTLYWVLLLVYVGYSCWLCCASGNRRYWLLLLVYEGPRTTHFTGYCCGLCEVSGNTLYWASLIIMSVCRLHQWVQNTIFLKISNSGKVEVSVSAYWSEYPLAKKITVTASWFTKLTSTNVP